MILTAPLWCALVLMACDGGGGTNDGSGGTGGAAPGAIQLSVEDELVRVVRPSGGELRATVARGEGVEGSVTVEVQGLPPGTEAPSVQLDASDNDLVLPVTVLTSAAQGGPTPITIYATLDDDTSIEDNVTLDLYVTGPRGSLDESFGQGGTYHDDDAGARPTRALVNDDGSIVLAGNASPLPNAWISRLTVSGEVDTIFGTGGEIIAPAEGDSTSALLSRSDGGFLWIGTFSDGGTSTVVRAFFPDGSVDTDFGTGGDIVFIGTPRFVARRGTGFVIATTSEAFAFDENGKQDMDYGPPTLVGNPMFGAEDANGGILTASAFKDGNDSGFDLGRLANDGTADPDFGFVGSLRVVAAMAPLHVVFVTGLAITPEGDGLVVGYILTELLTSQSIYLRFGATFFDTQVTTLPGEARADAVTFDANNVFYIMSQEIGGLGRKVIRAIPHSSTLADRTFGDQGETTIDGMTSFILLVDDRIGRLYVVGWTSATSVRVVRLWL